MIRVDPRAGSGDLAPILRSYGATVEVRQMQFGDVAWIGEGSEGPVGVGVEVKTVGDALHCMTDGRFAAHQVPGLLQSYEKIWLVVEGDYRAHPQSGILQTYHGEKRWYDAHAGTRQFMHREFEHWLASIEIQAGIRVRTTSDRAGTARLLFALYTWWQKEWGEHGTFKVFHRQEDPRHTGPFQRLLRPSTFRRVIKELPGLGWERAEAAERVFPSLLDAFIATEEEWEEVEGIGKGIAGKVVGEIKKEHII